jgi:hypothetical protein
MSNNIIRIKSDSSAPITFWGREGILKILKNDVAYVQFYDNSTLIIDKNCIEEAK